MVKVITYGTYDLLHYGHIRLLQRAKELGDYLIVGVTTDDFDKTRGKINVQQSLMERIEAVRATGLADQIIVEEYEGQKIDDIRRYDVDIFTVGSDWVGKFDYLKEYCEVVYLERTEGVSSTKIRSKEGFLRIGFAGSNSLIKKHIAECGFVNGIEVIGSYVTEPELKSDLSGTGIRLFDSYEELLNHCDAIYLVSVPDMHEKQIKQAIEKGVHVLCESPIAINKKVTKELLELAREKNIVLMESIKTAYATAYERLLLLIKSGIIGRIVSIDSVCTSLRQSAPDVQDRNEIWSGFEAWAPTALLPIYQILGTDVINEHFVTCFYPNQNHYDQFTQINVEYGNAVAVAKVGTGVKAEGQLIVAGTKGYVYVPAPWWKTDYFEVRFENQTENRRYFYQLEGEGIRYEIISFVRAIKRNAAYSNIDEEVSLKIADVFEKYHNKKNVSEIAVD